MDLREDTYFIGRSSELIKVVKNLQNGIHTLLTGDKGVGKSRLLIESVHVLNGCISHIQFGLHGQTGSKLNTKVMINPDKYHVLYVRYFTPLSIALKLTIKELFDKRLLIINDDSPDYDSVSWPEFERKSLRMNGGNLGLQNIIQNSVKTATKKMIFIFDNLDRITPAHQVFLEMMLSIATIGASTVILRDDVHLKKVWSSFDKIELKPLSVAESGYLVNYFLDNYPVKAIDKELLRNQVLKSASGNPFHIKNYLWQGSCNKYVRDEDVRSIREIDANRYLNLGPVYVFILISFTMIKIFSTGISAKESYIYFTGIGFITYVIFRVFRNFFLFKPQKQTSWYRA